MTEPKHVETLIFGAFNIHQHNLGCRCAPQGCCAVSNRVQIWTFIS